MKLVFATNNMHKLSEAQQILGPEFVLVTPRDMGVTDEIPEEQDTLEGNALQKAYYIHERTGADCFADDTGLEVEALDGEPGVYSARYAGPECSFEDNTALLLRNMEGVESRGARFRTVIALILGGEEYIFEGEVHGEITREPSGGAGFGYDPVFRPDGCGQTFAEMDAAQKNAISHRGRAMERLAAFLADYPRATVSDGE
ncbi:RdgB/HAM1 family non-canonical purine NTP pyrophosphatase [Alistipes sp. OttesenSCG-928-B03]|nr:RdgB/HAM1 family non-canonical purine NTP pyrophosphatase [Alistipes sp. OttesenSCG-928-B03]